uniref:SET domain-containing protein n=1 Tax=Chromera velia CCMP2878 TaxID=1169474 RepID=A0A0G4I151_9ALVE|eukprot:Cvel_10074.t1-p1 / transcript=Cvel_10074.t1 / gene=Cvel_10074 / organism=Chromera_velia_CCMP2878 / gene_product=N-lysine methyltransferase setd6, putative / transcript_product=N-lysine methyltransferase setd6, putative / location=Cvel_scaffold599:60187-63054(+) / protein_length=794 / sequence_SO=supercontig / SO=protein_coding / is_pseudo=false
MQNKGSLSDAEDDRAYAKWLKDSANVLLKKCAIGLFPQTGRGAVATEDIKEGEVVVSVPSDSIILAGGGGAEEIDRVLEDHELVFGNPQSVEQSVALVVTMMAEWCKGDESQWGPYLHNVVGEGWRNVPDLPIFWDRKSKALTVGTSFFEKPGCGFPCSAFEGPEDRHLIDRLWEDRVRPLVEEHYELFIQEGAGGDDEEDEDVERDGETVAEESQELFYVMAAVASSYSFELGDDKYQAMVPFWDMLNHVTGRVNVRLHHCEETDQLQMIASKDIPAWSEVINSYGHLGTGALARSYGFIEPFNVVGLLAAGEETGGPVSPPLPGWLETLVADRSKESLSYNCHERADLPIWFLVEALVVWEKGGKGTGNGKRSGSEEEPGRKKQKVEKEDQKKDQVPLSNSSCLPCPSSLPSPSHPHLVTQLRSSYHRVLGIGEEDEDEEEEEDEETIGLRESAWRRVETLKRLEFLSADGWLSLPLCLPASSSSSSSSSASSSGLTSAKKEAEPEGEEESCGLHRLSVLSSFLLLVSDEWAQLEEHVEGLLEGLEGAESKSEDEKEKTEEKETENSKSHAGISPPFTECLERFLDSRSLSSEVSQTSGAKEGLVDIHRGRVFDFVRFCLEGRVACIAGEGEASDLDIFVKGVEGVLKGQGHEGETELRQFVKGFVWDENSRETAASAVRLVERRVLWSNLGELDRLKARETKEGGGGGESALCGGWSCVMKGDEAKMWREFCWKVWGPPRREGVTVEWLFRGEGGEEEGEDDEEEGDGEMGEDEDENDDEDGEEESDYDSD